MKITTFNTLIITRDPDAAIELFEKLGFKQHHIKRISAKSKPQTSA